MKIVCTGGTGFLGAGLIPALTAQGHTVVLLTRRQMGKPSPPDAKVRTVFWNGRDGGAWAGEIDEAGAVINFAGEPLDQKRWTPAQKTLIRESRVNATRAIVTAIAGASRRPAVLINASAVGYYGDTGDAPVTEKSPPGGGLLAETCIRWEAEAWAAEKLGVRTVVLRAGPALGEKGGFLPKMVLAFRLYSGGPFGSGRQWFPWVHRDDFVSVVLHTLADSSYSGPINVAAPEAVTNRQFCTALGKVLRRPCWLPVPEAVLKVALGEMASMVLEGQYVIPTRLQELGFPFRYPDLVPALMDVLRHP